MVMPQESRMGPACSCGSSAGGAGRSGAGHQATSGVGAGVETCLSWPTRSTGTAGVRGMASGQAQGRAGGAAGPQQRSSAGTGSQRPQSVQHSSLWESGARASEPPPRTTCAVMHSNAASLSQVAFTMVISAPGGGVFGGILVRKDRGRGAPSASQSLGTSPAEPGEELGPPLRLVGPRHLRRGAGGGVGAPPPPRRASAPSPRSRGRSWEPLPPRGASAPSPRSRGKSGSTPSASQSLGTSPAEPGEELGTPSASWGLGTFAAEPGEKWEHPLRLAGPRHLPRRAGGGVRRSPACG